MTISSRALEPGGMCFKYATDSLGPGVGWKFSSTRFSPVFPGPLSITFLGGTGEPVPLQHGTPARGTAQPLSASAVGPRSAGAAPSPTGLKLRIKHQIKDQIWIFCALSSPAPPTSQSIHCSCKSSLLVFGESQNEGFSLQSCKPRLNYFSNAVCNGYYPEFGCAKFSWFPTSPHPGVCSLCSRSSLHKQAAGSGSEAAKQAPSSHTCRVGHPCCVSDPWLWVHMACVGEPVQRRHRWLPCRNFWVTQCG